jgi:metal-responsive CopG/Arc/MetJ family transcriptional regulator
MGRPTGRTQDRPFQIRLTEQFLTKVDDWRRKQPDLPSRSEAIRRIVEAHLADGGPSK